MSRRTKYKYSRRRAIRGAAARSARARTRNLPHRSKQFKQSKRARVSRGSVRARRGNRSGSRSRRGGSSATQPDRLTEINKIIDRLKSTKNHYKVLDIDIKASDTAIKRAYRSLAFKLHPDKFPNRPSEGAKLTEAEFIAIKVQAVDAFKKVGNANDMLMDPQRRAAYDKQLRLARTKKEESAFQEYVLRYQINVALLNFKEATEDENGRCIFGKNNTNHPLSPIIQQQISIFLTFTEFIEACHASINSDQMTNMDALMDALQSIYNHCMDNFTKDNLYRFQNVFALCKTSEKLVVYELGKCIAGFVDEMSYICRDFSNNPYISWWYSAISLSKSYTNLCDNIIEALKEYTLWVEAGGAEGGEDTVSLLKYCADSLWNKWQPRNVGLDHENGYLYYESKKKNTGRFSLRGDAMPIVRADRLKKISLDNNIPKQKDLYFKALTYPEAEKWYKSIQSVIKRHKSKE